MKLNTPRRCWINQPSTLQPLHEYHGVRVLAMSEPDDDSDDPLSVENQEAVKLSKLADDMFLTSVGKDKRQLR